MPSGLQRGSFLYLTSHALPPDLRFAEMFPVGALMMLAVVQRSFSYIANFTGDSQYFYILREVWGVGDDIKFRYKKVQLQFLKVNL
jgi:hypothetical protein